MLPAPPTSTLFPYPTLFRSHVGTLDPRQIHFQSGAVVQLQERLGEVGELGAQGGVARLGQHLEGVQRSEEHTPELQSLRHLVCRLLLEKKKKKKNDTEV